jgi:hypothetical protein
MTRVGQEQVCTTSQSSQSLQHPALGCFWTLVLLVVRSCCEDRWMKTWLVITRYLMSSKQQATPQLNQIRNNITYTKEAIKAAYYIWRCSWWSIQAWSSRKVTTCVAAMSLAQLHLDLTATTTVNHTALVNSLNLGEF